MAAQVPPHDGRGLPHPDMRDLVQEEERMKGYIPWSVYSEYVVTGGAVLFVVVAIIFIVALTSHAGGDYWLSVWTTNKLGYFRSFLLCYSC